MSHVTATRPFTSIPDRATCQIPIRVGKSSIPGAGRGIFALEDVEAGGPIFSIKEPLLNIVDDDESLKSVCDNCFAAKVDGLWSVEDRGIGFEFEACEACGVLWYCDESCRSIAWEHHHRYECDTFKAINACPDPTAISMLKKSNLRSMIRLLDLYKHHQILEDEWNEFLSLYSGRKSKMKRPDFCLVANSVTSIVKTFTKTELSEDKIIDLFCIFHNNQLVIGLPLLRGERSYNPKKHSVVSGGIILDPLAAMMNHSCSANARWYHNGKELRIRARSNIEAGDELTICYDPTEDYTLRRSHLKEYGINCSCPICHVGDIGPTGPFRRKMLHLAHSNQQRKNLEMEGLENAIEDMRLHDMGYGIYPMRDVHQQAYLAYLNKGKTTECLKLALKIYYQVEPMISPPIYEDYRLCTLYTIVSLMNPSPSDKTNLETLPPAALAIIPNVFLGLRYKIASDTGKCYGADSSVARFERQLFVETTERLAKLAIGSPHYTAYDDSTETRKEFETSMKDLLRWAGIDVDTESISF